MILAATLDAVPSIPATDLVPVLPVDRFVGMARALGNLVGNCVATVAAWEGDLDRVRAHAGARQPAAGPGHHRRGRAAGPSG